MVDFCLNPLKLKQIKKGNKNYLTTDVASFCYLFKIYSIVIKLNRLVHVIPSFLRPHFI